MPAVKGNVVEQERVVAATIAKLEETRKRQQLLVDATENQLEMFKELYKHLDG